MGLITYSWNPVCIHYLLLCRDSLGQAYTGSQEQPSFKKCAYILNMSVKWSIDPKPVSLILSR